MTPEMTIIEASVIQAIGSVGFPIVAFLLMYYHSTRTIKDNTKVLSELCMLLRSK